MAALQVRHFLAEKGGPGDTLMSLSVTAYTTGHVSEILNALPYILVLWYIVNKCASFIVEKWRISQYQAAGKDVEVEKKQRFWHKFIKSRMAVPRKERRAI